MRIQHNQGQFVQNQYNRTNTDLNKTLQKLSSGYQINGAADDAAGLSISEKMKAQIRGLEQAGENIQDGISLIQTAEGGIAQIQNPNLQRIRELIIQAANDTNTPEDRALIQKEIDQIVQGIDDIAEDTEFNTIQVLTPDRVEGGSTSNEIEVVFLVDDTGSMSSYLNSVRLGLGTFFDKMSTFGNVKVGLQSIAEGGSYPFSSDIDQLKANLGTLRNGVPPTRPYELIEHVTGMQNSDRGGIRFSNDPNVTKVMVLLTDVQDESDTSIDSDTAYMTGLENHLTSNKIQSYVFGFGMRQDGQSYFNKEYPKADKVYTPTSHQDISENITPGLAEDIIENAGQTEQLQQDVIIQAGANEGQTIKIPLYNNRSAALGISDIQVDPYEVAMEGLRRVDIANKILSERRSTYGAIQNQLEHAYTNVSNMEINLADANSKLKDADMAKETMKLHKDQVLLQSSQSMMAQINQMGQGILELLK